LKGFLSFCRAVGQRQDLALVAVLALTVGMLIMPMPAPLADMLIGCNLALSVLLMMVAVYLRSPLDLTALPGLILVSTVFRLALEVTVTRLILTTGDAGTIVETFGEFVIGGNIVVGLVVFAIVTTVQFIVVTKGTERVAEVGARFTLDAMPGKQMSIDSDLRSGDIDATEARRRRHELASESALHGAMDGALKFVKGDAIAGLVIIVVNLVAGISIGTTQRGMAIGDAMSTYTLLTVGDALIAQIPALLLSITAAIVVTRVGGHDTDLGRDMVRQLTTNRGPLRVASFMLLIMALIPGFPKPVFLGLSFLFLVGSRPDWGALRTRLRFRKTATDVQDGLELSGEETQSGNPSEGREVFAPLVAITLSAALDSELDRGRLERLLALAGAEVEGEFGIRCPRPRIRKSSDDSVHRFSIEIEDVPVEDHEIRPTHLLLHDDPVHLDLAGIDGETGHPLLGHEPSVWIPAIQEGRLKAAHIGYQDAAGIVATRFRSALRKHATRFIGLQEARQIVQRLESDYSDLVREAMRIVPVQRLAEVFRRLVEEEVSLRNMRLILETLVEWGEKEARPLMLVEYVRQALARQICHRYAGAQKALAAFVLGQETEQLVRQAIRDTPGGAYLALDPDASQQFLASLRQYLARDSAQSRGQVLPIVVTSVDVRRFVRGFLVRNGMENGVLSYQDLADDFPIHPIGSIDLTRGSGSAEIARAQ